MKLTKSQLREIIKEELLKESKDPMEIFNKAKGVVKDYKRLRNELESLKSEYESAQRGLLNTKLKEYVDVISNKLSSISKVSSRGGTITITLTGDNKTSFRYSNDILGLVHEAIGETSVFKAINVKTNSYTEIQSMTLGFTQKYIKSTHNLPSWSSLKMDY